MWKDTEIIFTHPNWLAIVCCEMIFAVINLQFAVISLQFAVIDLQNFGLLKNDLQSKIIVSNFFDIFGLSRTLVQTISKKLSSWAICSYCDLATEYGCRACVVCGLHRGQPGPQPECCNGEECYDL